MITGNLCVIYLDQTRVTITLCRDVFELSSQRLQQTIIELQLYPSLRQAFSPNARFSKAQRYTIMLSHKFHLSRLFPSLIVGTYQLRNRTRIFEIQVSHNFADWPYCKSSISIFPSVETFPVFNCGNLLVTKQNSDIRNLVQS